MSHGRVNVELRRAENVARIITRAGVNGDRIRSMDAYVIIGSNDSGKSSLTRCLTGSGSGKIRTRPIAILSGVTIDVYVHISSLQENYKRVRDASDFARQVRREKCDAVLFTLWPHGRGGRNKRPDADTYLRHFISQEHWNVVKVACLGNAATSITTALPKGVIKSFSEVTAPGAKTPMPANTVAELVREHFGWK